MQGLAQRAETVALNDLQDNTACGLDPRGLGPPAAAPTGSKLAEEQPRGLWQANSSRPKAKNLAEHRARSDHLRHRPGSARSCSDRAALFHLRARRLGPGFLQPPATHAATGHCTRLSGPSSLHPGSRALEDRGGIALLARQLDYPHPDGDRAGPVHLCLLPLSSIWASALISHAAVDAMSSKTPARLITRSLMGIPRSFMRSLILHAGLALWNLTRRRTLAHDAGARRCKPGLAC